MGPLAWPDNEGLVVRIIQIIRKLEPGRDPADYASQR